MKLVTFSALSDLLVSEFLAPPAIELRARLTILRDGRTQHVDG